MIIADIGNWTPSELNPHRKGLASQAARRRRLRRRAGRRACRAGFAGWHWCAYVENTGCGRGLGTRGTSPTRDRTARITEHNRRAIASVGAADRWARSAAQPGRGHHRRRAGTRPVSHAVTGWRRRAGRGRRRLRHTPSGPRPSTFARPASCPSAYSPTTGTALCVRVDDRAEVLGMPDALDGLVDCYRGIAGEHPDCDEHRAAMAGRDECLRRITSERCGPDRLRRHGTGERRSNSAPDHLRLGSQATPVVGDRGSVPDTSRVGTDDGVVVMAARPAYQPALASSVTRSPPLSPPCIFSPGPTARPSAAHRPAPR